jgi:hypothetical protein
LVEILDQGETTEAGLRITDLRMGSGEQLREGDTTNLRFRSQRVSLDSHLYKDWSGEADLSLQLSADGTQVEAFWRSLIGMREGGLRRIVIGPPASDGLKGIRNGQAYDFPSGTTWSYEVEAVSTLPEARSRIGVQIDIGSSLVGALISEVVGDPARQAGIAPGDLISSIDGVEIGSGQHGMRLFRRLEPQVPVRLMVSRGGAELELTIVPGEAPARETSDQTAESGALWIGGDAVLP